MPEVVAVQKGDEFSASEAYAGIASGGYTSVLLSDIVYRRAERACDIRCGICGSVVHNYNFRVSKALALR
jgi:hypothetical protein